MTDWKELITKIEMLKIKMRITQELMVFKKQGIMDKIKNYVEMGEPYIYTHEVSSFILANDEILTSFSEIGSMVDGILRDIEPICHENLSTKREFSPYQIEAEVKRIQEIANVNEPPLPDEIKDNCAEQFLQREKGVKRAGYASSIIKMYPQYRLQLRTLFSNLATGVSKGPGESQPDVSGVSTESKDNPGDFKKSGGSDTTGE